MEAEPRLHHSRTRLWHGIQQSCIAGRHWPIQWRRALQYISQVAHLAETFVDSTVPKRECQMLALSGRAPAEAATGRLPAVWIPRASLFFSAHHKSMKQCTKGREQTILLAPCFAQHLYQFPRSMLRFNGFRFIRLSPNNVKFTPCRRSSKFLV